MADVNPFGDIDREFQETLARHLAKAEALDAMDDDLNTWECDFLESILRQLRDEKRPLTQGQLNTLNNLCNRYEIDLENP